MPAILSLTILLHAAEAVEKIPKELEPFCIKITENIIKIDAKSIYDMGSPAFKALGKPEKLQKLLSAMLKGIGIPQKVDYTVEGYQIYQGGKTYIVRCVLHYKRPLTVRMRIKETPTGFLLDGLNINPAPSNFLKKIITLAAQGKEEEVYENYIPEQIKQSFSKKVILDILDELGNFIKARWEIEGYTIKEDGSEHLVYKVTDQFKRKYLIDFTVKWQNGKYYLLDVNIKSI